jgi:hypothetical protein
MGEAVAWPAQAIDTMAELKLAPDVYDDDGAGDEVVEGASFGIAEEDE